MEATIESIPAIYLGSGAKAWHNVFGFVRVLKVVQNEDGMVTPIVLRDPQNYTNYSLEFTCLGDGFNFDLEESGEYLGSFAGEDNHNIHLFVKVRG